jgi:hypothetical protein
VRATCFRPWSPCPGTGCTAAHQPPQATRSHSGRAARAIRCHTP